ncbi:MAG: prepilin peptidase [Micrococcales bacterium]|nr:prepilin peptidase [Micrococcales bacterium]
MNSLAAAVGPGLAWPAYLYLGVIALVASWIDGRSGLIPNRLTLPSYPVLVALLAVAAATGGSWPSFGRALAGGVSLVAFYLLLAYLAPGSLGMGDVKLAGLLGLGLAYSNWAALGLGTLAGFIIAGGLGLFHLLRGHGAGHSFPFGPAMCLGALAGLLAAAPLT